MIGKFFNEVVLVSIYIFSCHSPFAVPWLKI